LRPCNGEVELFFRLGQDFEPFRIDANGDARQSQASARRQRDEAGGEGGFVLNQAWERQGTKGVQGGLAAIAGYSMGYSRSLRRRLRVRGDNFTWWRLGAHL
jgi:hypothetical protein